MSSSSEDTAKLEIGKLFGLYKAEWLNGELFELFREPYYFRELTTNRPCILIGGRGTGKTTVLRGLSYDGQFALKVGKPVDVRNWPFYGIYYRVNTNRVTAFKGPELNERQWQRVFGHYVNLVLCGSLLDFLGWYEKHTQISIDIPSGILNRVSTSFHLEKVTSYAALSDMLELTLTRFEANINNIADGPPSNLSIQGGPLDLLADGLAALPIFKGKQFYFLIDEFENFEDYQQKVMNTVIKHASSSYTFKVGVRELGWRERSTLNEHEQLTHPADYARINIRDELTAERFGSFATTVCQRRLERIRVPGIQISSAINTLLPGLSEEAEFGLLGGIEKAKSILTRIEEKSDTEHLEYARSISPSELFFVDYWTTNQSQDLLAGLKDHKVNRLEWTNRFNNHFYASLFTIKKGKRGFHKLYAGYDTFARMADGNIRYFLELVHTSLLKHFESGGALNSPVDPQVQTEAAQLVGHKNLVELEGLTVEGARLTKLLLSLGRVFGVMATAPEGHTPEVNQFYLRDSDKTVVEDFFANVKRILDQAVMHLALVRYPGNKLLDEADIREYEYMIHPIFAAFFRKLPRQADTSKVEFLARC